MSDSNHAGGMPPPGWLLDNETGRIRWWDGVRWTDLVKPLDPVVHTGPAYHPVSAASVMTFGPSTSRNGPARAALVIVVLAVLGIAAFVWFAAEMDALVAAVLTSVTVAMVAAAFVLAITGLVIAIRRPTKKGAAIFAVVVSSLLVSVVAFRVLVALLP